MKFEADILFEEFPLLFCSEFDEGHQIFSSWQEFITNITHYMHEETRPKYAFKADSYDDLTVMKVFVDVSQVVEIPWDELDSYI